MRKIRIMDVQGTEFPSGRITRVLLGENGAINGDYFCQGYVIVYPGGTVPVHDHIMVESYTVLQGDGEVIVNGECQPVHAGELVYMEPNQPHGLRNTGNTDMHLMFVYARSRSLRTGRRSKAGNSDNSDESSRGRLFSGAQRRRTRSFASVRTGRA